MIPKMENFEKFKSVLPKQVQACRELIEQPKMFIDEYFTGIRTKIDLVVETALQKLVCTDETPEALVDKQTDEPDTAQLLSKEQQRQNAYDRLNSTREEIIQVLAHHEKQLMANADILVSGEAWKRSTELLDRADKEMAAVFGDDQYSEWIDYDVQFARISRQILQHVHQLEEQAMGKQTFKFYYSRKNPGILIHLQDVYFNTFDQNVFRAYIAEKTNDFKRSFISLNQMMHREYYGSLGPYNDYPFTVDKKMTRMAFLALILKAAITLDTKQHVFHLDNKFLDLEFDTPLSPEHQELKDALHAWYKSWDRDFKPTDDPFHYATRIGDLKISASKPSKLSIPPKMASSIVSLSLKTGRLVNFDEEFFGSLKNLGALKLRDAFDFDTEFNLNFLANLNQLSRLEVTLPNFFTFNCLPKKNLAQLSLSTAATRDSNAPRLKLFQKSFDVLGAMPRLRRLELRGFELGPCQLSNLYKMLSKVGKRLKHLNLSDNNLTYIAIGSFYSFRELESLDLSMNQLESLPTTVFEQLQQIQGIDLSSNNLGDLPQGMFDSLRTLTHLNLSNNKIQNIYRFRFELLTELREFVLKNNPISTINAKAFSGLRKLESLDLSHCQLKSIDAGIFIGFDKLRQVDLSHNRISAILLNVDGREEPIQVNKPDLSEEVVLLVMTHMFTNNRCLRSFQLGNNQLEELNLICFCNLVGEVDFLFNNAIDLDLSNNKIARLCDQSPNTHDQWNINLSDNHLEQVDAGCFRKLTRRCKLDLRNNPLDMIISPETFEPSSLPRSLILLGNKSVTIQDEAWALMNGTEKLHLESDDPNLATKLAGFNQLSSLAVHKSSQPVFDALMTSNDATLLADLTSIDFSHSSIASLEHVTLGARCRELTELILSGNSLQVIKPEWFAGLDNLYKLDLSNNLIESLDDPDIFVDCDILRELNISGNKLKQFKHPIIKRLEYLNLSNNSIDVIPDDMFKPGSLCKLNLSGNGIKKFNLDRLFNNLAGLHEIDLSHNQLCNRSINEESAKLLQVQRNRTAMILSFNPSIAINLSHNQLTDLKFVRNLVQFTDLNLSYNKIESIYDEKGVNLLGRLVNLKRLDLSHNQLRTIKQVDLDYLTKRVQEHFDISNNPIAAPEEPERSSKKRRRSVSL